MKKATRIFAKTSKTVARNVHVMVKDNDMSVKEFAKATSLSAGTVRRIENAYKFKRPYNPQLSTLIKLNAATGISLDELVNSRLPRLN